MAKINVMPVTTSRADYGLLRPLLFQLAECEDFNLQLIAGGMHLKKAFGDTIKEIEKDGLEISECWDILSKGDSEDSLCNTISTGISKFSEIIIRFKPDYIIMLGDRYELLAAATASVIHKIPVVHIHGGESTYGLIDDAVRNSLTKMAAVHLPSIELYGRRIIQMGEDPERVFIVGALGIDNIKSIEPMSIIELEQYTGISGISEWALMTYHPVTLDAYDSAETQITSVLSALLELNIKTLITMPNSDTGGESISRKIDEYVLKYPCNFFLKKSLGQRAYLSAMRYARLMIGNSSSGIIESASFSIPVVNIGDRQGGRFKPSNIIDCKCEKEDIVSALKEAQSLEFRKSLEGLSNPYGDGNTAARIIEVLKQIRGLDRDRLLKKGFFDLDSNTLKRLSEKRVIS